MVERRSRSPSPIDIKETTEKIFQKQRASQAASEAMHRTKKWQEEAKRRQQQTEKKKQQEEEEKKRREEKKQQEKTRDRQELARLSQLLQEDGVDKYSQEGVAMMLRRSWLGFKLNPQEETLHEIGDFQDTLAEKNPQLYSDYTRKSIDGFNRQTNQFIEMRRMILSDEIYQKAIQGLRAGKN